MMQTLLEALQNLLTKDLGGIEAAEVRIDE